MGECVATPLRASWRAGRVAGTAYRGTACPVERSCSLVCSGFWDCDGNESFQLSAAESVFLRSNHSTQQRSPALPLTRSTPVASGSETPLAGKG